MQIVSRLALPALAAALALSGCVTGASKAPLADGIDVALGQRAMVGGPVVQPVEVVEDSRCPMNARCVWAGRVRVKMLWLRPTGESHPFEVTLGEATPLADGAIRLESVRPEKRSSAPIAAKDYRFSFRFDGGL